jgi:predicted alpha/beta hydrolase
VVAGAVGVPQRFYARFAEFAAVMGRFESLHVPAVRVVEAATRRVRVLSVTAWRWQP